MTVAARTDTQELLRLAIGPACHELRSPLAVVYGFARMLEGDEQLDERSLGYIKQVVRGAERLDSMLDDLSKLGRVAAGRLHPTIEHFPLQAVVDDLAATEANAGRLIVDQGTDVTVKGDSGWLSESIQATVDALCFEEGIDVRLSWRHEPHDVHIQIVPNSSFPMIDIEPEKSSLGLSLARMRVVSMGGTFDGGGDRISIVLPRA